ncbi:MAG TPA: tetratricopeptide repeat protein [Candidatus Krumholzibacteria bacterium]|nr:tetratricopeptide repeat protein [Candidatus Krumholzibacteria bacterium]
MKTMLRILALLTIVAAVHGAATAAVDPPRPVETIGDLPRDARLALYEAQVLMEEGKIEQSAAVIEKYVRKTEKKDDRFFMRYHLASVLAQVDRREEALAQYERAVALEPRYGPAWLGLGETAYGLGNYARAVEALKRGYALMEEKRPDVLYYAAAAQVQAGDAAGAIPVLEELATGKHGEPRFEWHRGLLSACLLAEDRTRGQSAVSAMLEKFGTKHEAWHLAFQYGASVGDYRQAAIALTVTGYLRPLSKQETIQLGDLYAAVDAPAAAAGFYTAAAGDSASAGEIERIASSYLASYQTDAALEVLEKGIRTAPTFRLWSLLGDLHVMEKRFEPAYDAFAECVRRSPGEPRPELMMGYCALELGRLDEAITHLATAAEAEEFAERAQMLIRRAQQLARLSP